MPRVCWLFLLRKHSGTSYHGNSTKYIALLLDILELQFLHSTVLLHDCVYPAGAGRFVGLESECRLWSSSKKRASKDRLGYCFYNGPGLVTKSKLEEAGRLAKVGEEVQEVLRWKG